MQSVNCQKIAAVGVVRREGLGMERGINNPSIPGAKSENDILVVL